MALDTILWSTEYDVPAVGDTVTKGNIRYIVINREWVISDDGTPVVTLFVSQITPE